MIKVNLLPHEMRPIQRTLLPHVVSLLVLAAAIMYMGQIFITLQGEVSIVNQQLAQQQAALDALADVVAEFNELSEQKVLLQDKIAIIQEILEDRTIWSQHLYQLTTLTPENIWYRRIRLTSRRFSEERPVIDKKTEKQEIDPRTQRPRTTRVQVERAILEVSGYAIDDETGLSSTHVLASNTETDPDFSQAFTLYRSEFADTEFNGYPVRQFTFEYLVAG
jgi:Tfp pilus assembly protein PilN